MGAPGIVLRDLAREHLDGVMAVETAAFPVPWSRRMFEEEIGRPFSDVLVALEGARVVGYSVCWTVGEESHLLNLAVTPAVRRRGVGTRMLRECLRRAARAGAARIHLEVRASNGPAIAMYRKEGFRPVGIRRGYYTDNGEDALLLSREIGAADAR